MENSVSHWQLAGFVFTAAVGTLLHFMFDLTHENSFVALFSAVNESIWEHMKLLFWPMILFALVEYSAWGKERTQFWCVKLLGILLGLILIPVLYYTYTGSLGISADWFNITIFFISAALVFRVENVLFQRETGFSFSPALALGGLCLIMILFMVLTFFSPHIPLFRDAATGEYGIGKALR